MIFSEGVPRQIPHLLLPFASRIIWPSFRPIPWHTNAVAIWNSPNWAYGESQSWRPAGTQAYKVQPNRVVHHHVARHLQLHLGIARMAVIHDFSVNLGIDFSKTNVFFGFATRNLLLHVWIYTFLHILYLICIYLYYPMSFVAFLVVKDLVHWFWATLNLELEDVTLEAVSTIFHCFYYEIPVVPFEVWPASSPYVTSVGATMEPWHWRFGEDWLNFLNAEPTQFLFEIRAMQGFGVCRK